MCCPMFRLIFILLFFSLSSLRLVSQNTIEGSIINAENEPIDLALVSIFTLPDSSIYKSVYSDIDGSFLITISNPGKYYLQINMLSYHEYTKEIEIKNNFLKLKPISLVANNVVLSTVTITSKVPFIERKIDRTVVNVESLISSAGDNALETLEKVPGIFLDNNGSIILKGRSGVTVFINDKPSYLSGAELENYLKSLPSSSISKIEIMTNPPAKYDAAGNSGVINIIIKRNALLGFHGSAATSYQQSRYSSSNNSLNLNLNKNKLNISANVYAGFYGSFQDLNINRYYKNEFEERISSFSQNSFIKSKGTYINSKIGLDYFLTDDTSIGASYKISSSSRIRTTDNNAIIKDNTWITTQQVIADNLQKSTFSNQLYNAYISHKLDTLGSAISMDVDYVQYTTGNDQLFKNYLLNPSNEIQYEDQINGDLPVEINIFALKSDYIKPFQNNSKIEAGLKSAYTTTNNQAIYTKTLDGVTENNYDLSNQFLYEEWINAAYLNYSKSYNKIDLQFGLRGEATTLSGDQLGNIEKPASSFKRNYQQLFPTFYALWRIDDKNIHTLNFSYGRRIDRPNFQDLNPFISPLDQFTYYGGNPNLTPTFSNNLSLSHSYKNLLTTSISFSKVIDGINETLEINDGIYYSRPGNIDTNYATNLSTSINVPITNWYTFNTYLEYNYLIFKSALYTEQLNARGGYYYLSTNNNFNLGNNWKIDLSANYRSDMVYSQLILASSGVVNCGVQKSILNNKLTFRIAINDIFYTQRGNGIINNLRLTDADWNSKYDSRRASFTCSYRFGKSTFDKQLYKSSGSESEQNRVSG